MEEAQGIRINKYLTESGHCSRREADRLISEGRITVNDVVPPLGTRVTDADVVKVDGKTINAKGRKFVYIAFNKPVGIVCTTDTEVEKDNIIDYIKYPTRIFPIGRLDKPSEGLILLTDDGDIINRILRASNNHEKEYLVTVDRPVTRDFVLKMGAGVPILDTVTRKCLVEQTGRFTFRIVLTQGLNRQIRRMCAFLGYEVKALKRIRIMNIGLDMPSGKWRHLSEKELEELHALIATSKKTAP
jgi:23S rRNA pseudouridine2604 synthase